LKVIAIIEHDVEVLSNLELEDRLQNSRKHGYKVYQYVDEDPETMLYTLTTEKINTHNWFQH
jgi:hypothetical protein